jgi:hypothetical protein
VGLKLALLVYTDGSLPDLSRPVDRNLADVAHVLFPRTPYVHAGPTRLHEGGFPGRGSFAVGAFEGGLLLATRDAYLFNPTKLHRRYLKPVLGRTVTLLTQQPTYDMFAYARWENGQLQRSLSANPVGQIWESIGIPEPFEAPFWAGQRPAPAGYPLPFHPLDMSNAALRSVLHLHAEGPSDPGLVDIATVIANRFER